MRTHGHVALLPAIAGALLLSAATHGELRAEAIFELGEATLPPGATSQSIPISIDADAAPGDIVAFSMVVRYDPSALGSVSIESLRDADMIVIKTQAHFVEPGLAMIAVFYSLGFPRPERFVTPENDGLIARLNFCVLETAPPGVYPLEFAEVGELHQGQPQHNIYTANGATGFPDLIEGSVTVSGTPVSGGDCPVDVHEFEPPSLPPEPPSGFEMQGTFSLSDRTAVAGEEVTVPLTMRANWEVRGYSFSIDFDEEVLEGTSVTEIYQREDGEDIDFALYDVGNDNPTPGNTGVEEGYIAGAVIFSHIDPWVAVPRDTDVDMLALGFRVRPEAVPGETSIQFVDGASFSWGGQPLMNIMTVHNRSVEPLENSSFVFIPAFLNVLPDIQVFIRGDSDGSGGLDIVDPQRTLEFLFRGGRRPACYDAADANDDGLLNVSDAMFTLNFLFLTGSAPSAPYPDEGEDPTDDALGCLVRGSAR